MAANAYFKELFRLLSEVFATDARGIALELDAALQKVMDGMTAIQQKAGKIIFIGNGGSAAIASHQAVDYWKNGKIPAVAFNDASLLTCLSNDYGYAHVFEKSVQMFANPQDMLFAISSSGRSENILRGVRAAQEKGCGVITFSGFDKGNPLRSLGDTNFYVASHSYGPVEIAHLTLSHYMLDQWMKSAPSRLDERPMDRRYDLNGIPSKAD